MSAFPTILASSIAEHPSKTQFPIDDTLSIITDVKEEHPRNASLSIVVALGNSRIPVKLEQFRNALYLIVITLFKDILVFRLLQPANAESSIRITDSSDGIDTSEPHHLNAHPPTLDNATSLLTLLSESHPSKQNDGILEWFPSDTETTVLLSLKRLPPNIVSKWISLYLLSDESYTLIVIPFGTVTDVEEPRYFPRTAVFVFIS
jgi:hypothetical protein